MKNTCSANACGINELRRPIKYPNFRRQSFRATLGFGLIDLDAQMIVPFMRLMAFAVLHHLRSQSGLGVVEPSLHLAPLVMVFYPAKKLIPEKDFLRLLVQARRYIVSPWQ